ncbi:kinesin [Penicillium malachiteum]|uniref:kinesin n=1 Tax=Penicillium malachiteum TaxID=1324776 RepID=UPI002546665A|nr:kinesin [Penicillium malachiteum]KAJ5735604.1 kinesin [Penicillium malachiteum]
MWGSITDRSIFTKNKKNHHRPLPRMFRFHETLTLSLVALFWMKFMPKVPLVLVPELLLLAWVGSGKYTQTANIHGWHFAETSKETWVFWMHAGNAARLQESFQDAADRLKIPNRHDPKANGRESADGRPLSSFLPRGSNGTLIMTTRTKDATLKLTDNKNIVEIHPMTVSDAVDLVNKKLDPPATEMDAQRLAEALGCMPLAIIQATSYVNCQSSSYSVSQYLAEFERNDRRKSKLLDYEAGHSHRDRDAKTSILITWRISFEQVRKMNSAAADLLSLMSFFDPHGISEDLLQELTESDDESEDDDDDCETPSSSDSDTDSEFEFDSTLQFRDNIAILRAYSFISVREDDQSSQVFSMHPLVQLAACQCLDAHNEGDKWRDEFVMILSSVFPVADFENWTECQSLLAHVQSAYIKKPHSDGALRAWQITLQDIRIQKSLKASKKACGEEHVNTIISMHNLATTYAHQGRLKEAEALEIKVLNLYKKILGEVHPTTILSMGNLAATYRHQGRLKEAEALEIKVLNLRRKILGEEHGDTILGMNRLACIWRKAGLALEALDLLRDCVAIKTRVLRHEHPETMKLYEKLLSWETEQMSLDVDEN